MGGWGCQAFENDDALDWLEGLESGGAEAVRQGLTAASWLEARPVTGIGTWR